MLFKDSNTVLRYAQFTGTINLLSIEPTLQMIEEVYIEDLLGSALYGSLNTAYGLIINETSLTSAQQNLLEACRKVIGRYLCYHYAPIAEIQVSESGVRRSENTNSKTAFQYQVSNYRNENLRQAELYVEKLLKFLEDNQDAYTEWVSSDSYKQYNALFIKSAKDFDSIYKTASPYRNYWAIRWKMIDVEQQAISNLLGDELYADLKTKNSTADYVWTDIEIPLINMLKKGIAYLTVAFAIPHLGVRVDAMGLTVAGPLSASNDDTAKRVGAASDKVSLLINTCENSGRTWLKNAYDYLIKNAETFPLFHVPVANASDTCKTEGFSDNTNANLAGSFGMA